MFLCCNIIMIRLIATVVQILHKVRQVEKLCTNSMQILLNGTENVQQMNPTYEYWILRLFWYVSFVTGAYAPIVVCFCSKSFRVTQI